MTTEFAGAIEIDPPLTRPEIAYVRRLGRRRRAGVDALGRVARRHPAPRARTRRGRDGARVAAAAGRAAWTRPSRFRGTVAVYDPETRELVALTVANGRVTVRMLRRPRAATGRSNVIDLATRRRAVSRAIG